MSAQPIIKKGRWEAPQVVPQWDKPAPLFDAQGQPLITKQVQGGQLPKNIQPEDYDLALYWENVELLLKAAAAEEAHPMDAPEQQDRDGAPVLPPLNPTGAKPKRPVWEVFLEQVAAIEEGFVPLGMINADGNLFKFVMPPGHMGEQIARRFTHIVGLVLAPASARFYPMYEQYLVVSNVLPCPVHVSPLGMLLIRDTSHCNRYTDSISVLLRLHILRHTLHSMDTENPEHKEVCWRMYKRLEKHASDRFYQALPPCALSVICSSPCAHRKSITCAHGKSKRRAASVPLRWPTNLARHAGSTHKI